MDRAIEFALFLTVFLSIYFTLNYYVIARMYSLFNMKKDIYFLLILGGLALSYLIASFLGKILPGILSKTVYFIASMWMGVMFLLFSMLIVFEAVNLMRKVDHRMAGIVMLIIAAIFTAYGLINAMDLKVKTIELPGFGKDIDAVQLTDIHVGTIRNSGFLKEIVEKTNALDPDVVFITGDLVDGSAPLKQEMFDALKKLKAPAYFVIGNHEIYEGEENVLAILSKTNMTVLLDEKVDFKGMEIIGIRYSEDNGYPMQALSKMRLNSSRPAIMLNHAPTGLDAAAENGIFLTLSGHTHGGQIVPFNLLTRLRYRYVSGLHEKDGSYLYVSDGTGTWGPMMRIGTRAEITRIKLRK